MSLNNLSNKQLRDGIAHAKWSYEHDAQKVMETREIESRNNLFTDLFGTSRRVDPSVKDEELRSLNESKRKLARLVQEAERRGMNWADIPPLSRNDGGQPVKL